LIALTFPVIILSALPPRLSSERGERRASGGRTGMMMIALRDLWFVVLLALSLYFSKRWLDDGIRDRTDAGIRDYRLG
jgi:hypothetical protein